MGPHVGFEAVAGMEELEENIEADEEIAKASAGDAVAMLE